MGDMPEEDNVVDEEDNIFEGEDNIVEEGMPCVVDGSFHHHIRQHVKSALCQ